MSVSDTILAQILGQLEAMQVAQQTMQAKVRSMLCPPFVPYTFFLFVGYLARRTVSR